jgi:hypothetical protein
MIQIILRAIFYVVNLHIWKRKIYSVQKSIMFHTLPQADEDIKLTSHVTEH